MMFWTQPSLQNDFLAPHVVHLLRSYQQLLGRDMIDPTLSMIEQARILFEAPFAVVSHNAANAGEEPIFNYGNQTALDLFAMTWEEFTRLPSRLSAEPVHQAERARLFERVRAQGYIDDYRGVRIAGTGRRFWIENATVWTLHDETGHLYGQAALFDNWKDLEP
jgi:hypothetical protein